MKYLIATLLVSAALPGLAAAQSTPRQGTLGSSSDGAIGLTLNVAETKQIRVDGLNDLTFDTDKGTTPQPQTEGFCVYMDESGTYDATVTAQPFQATGLTDVPFDLTYKAFNLQGAETDSQSTVFDGTTTELKLTGLTPSDTVDCPSGNSAEIAVILDAIPTEPGTLTTTVTILVEPT